MSARVQMKVVGISEALRHMREYEKDLYTEVTRQLRTSAQPLAQEVGGDFPERALTNWTGKQPTRRRKKKGKPFPGYEAASARGGVKPKVGIGKVVNGERSIVRIQQMTAGGAVLDGAGSRTSNIFVKNLDTYAPTKGTSKRGITRSRVMYGAVKKRMPMVETVVANAIDRTDKMVQQAISGRV
jgi:hypothetical protein